MPQNHIFIKRIMLTVVFMFSLVLSMPLFAARQSQPLQPGKETLREIESILTRCADIEAQITTLDMYTPEKFPDFQELEKVNQLMEQLDFNRRKMQLLTNQFKLLEEEFFPLLVKLVKDNRALDDYLAMQLAPYTTTGEKSIYFVRQKLNHVLLQVERQETKLEELQQTTHNRILEEERKKKPNGNGQTADVSTSIDQLQEELDALGPELSTNEEQIKALNSKEKEAAKKMASLEKQINSFKHASLTAKTKVEQLVYQTYATVREIRLNGLEIPLLNRIKTFKYLARVSSDTLTQKIAAHRTKIESLQKFRKLELLWKLLKGLGVIGIGLFCIFLAVRISRRIVRNIVGHIEGNEKIAPHRKQRYQTLSSVLLSFTKVAIWVLTILWILGQLEINYSPLLVAAGGISLAIAFGAQSLVKDVVSGFFILMEEQFLLGDNVDINGLNGTIEKISLRTVRLRALDGTLHTIPNGSITCVSNRTYIWSRILVSVGVSYQAEARQVLDILTRVATEMAHSEPWKELFLETPEAQGIISFGLAAVEYRVIAKTKTGSQWSISRELLIRIKQAFDQAGIEIPNYRNINQLERLSKNANTEIHIPEPNPNF